MADWGQATNSLSGNWQSAIGNLRRHRPPRLKPGLQTSGSLAGPPRRWELR
jgi:hypothetical protein